MKSDSLVCIWPLSRVLTAVGVCDEFSADLRTGDTLHTHTILHYTASTYNHTHYTPLKDPFLNWKCYNQIVGVWVQMHRNHTGYTSDPLITYLWFRLLLRGTNITPTISQKPVRIAVLLLLTKTKTIKTFC